MKCPKCGKEMRVRKGRFGRFYGCTGYPDCQRTVDLKNASEGEEKPQCLNDESFPCWDCKFRSTEHCPLLA